jgi:hypothetical protein
MQLTSRVFETTEIAAREMKRRFAIPHEHPAHWKWVRNLATSD